MGAVDGAGDSGTGGEVGEGSVGVGCADGGPLTGGLAAEVEVEVSREAEKVADDVIGDDVGVESTHVGERAGMVDEFGEEVMFEAGGGGLDPAEALGAGEEVGRGATEEGVGRGGGVERRVETRGVGDFEAGVGGRDFFEAGVVDGGVNEEVGHGRVWMDRMTRCAWVFYRCGGETRVT